jgi:hypothetical protein
MAINPELSQTMSSQIIGVVDGHEEAVRRTLSDGNYDFVTVELDTPRTIGDREARLLKLGKASSDKLVACATYYEGPESVPIRHIMIRKEGPTMGSYDDTMDERYYEVPDVQAEELLDDIQAISW